MSARRGHWLPLSCLGFVLLFTALGIWQLQRRTWKLELIARVNARVTAAAIAAPGPALWPSVTASSFAYRHVQLRGSWVADREADVLAATVYGRGYWVLVPLCVGPDGWCVLVNQGFVPEQGAFTTARQARRQLRVASPGPVTITGLLRISEPRGGFLHHNDPAAGRWYSRDVPAIGASLGIARLAPYFIDAQAVPGAAAVPSVTRPIAGLTVVTFRNPHLQYAITWFALALMGAFGAGVGWRERRRATTTMRAV